MIRLLRRFREARGGSVMVEFAFLAPVMAILFLGTFELTWAVRARMKVNNAAQTLALLIAAQTAVNTTTALPNFCNGAKLVLTPFSGTNFKAAVASVTNNGGTRAEDWHYEGCGSATAISGSAGLVTSLLPNSGDSVIIVKATFTYSTPIRYILPSSTTFTMTSFARPRKNATVTCTSCTQG